MHFLTSSRVWQGQEGYVLPTHHRCTTYTDSQHTLKHLALKRATATSHTPLYHRKGLSPPCPSHTQCCRQRTQAMPPLNTWTSLHTDSSQAGLLCQLCHCKTFQQAPPPLYTDFLKGTTGADTTSHQSHCVWGEIRKRMQKEFKERSSTLRWAESAETGALLFQLLWGTRKTR